jgi:beta-glucosidase
LKLINIILVIRVLCIGNSFSWDAVEQELVPLCTAKGVDVEIHNLYYGGCSLAQHADFLLKDTAAYSHRVCTNAEPRIVKDTITLRQVLQDGEYDFISLQQASHDSGIRSSYEPWLTMLIDTVKAYQPNAQLCWMQTWAYSRDAKHPAYPRYHSDQTEMWDSIRACTKLPIENHQLRLIPCGQAVQNARQTKIGDTLCRDGYHLNYTYGRYTAACVWYEILTGNDVRRNRYRNPQMTLRQRRLCQRSAHRAVHL